MNFVGQDGSFRKVTVTLRGYAGIEMILSRIAADSLTDQLSCDIPV